ncbi:MAG: hypothetical protein QF410_13580 [Planctomycetota bacterium]|nr:hypothetical protein [Planctomycetota bacterium]
MGRSIAIAPILVLALTGCQTLLDFERAEGILRRQAGPELPVLVEDPAAELPPVTGLVARSGELRRVPLRWPPVLTADVSGYAIERALEEAGPFARVGALAGRHQTRWLDQGADLAAKQGSPGGTGDLGDGHVYHYRVRAFDHEGHLAPVPATGLATARTAEVPAAPEGFHAFSRLPRRVALQWRPSDDPTTDGYVVYRSPTARGDFQAIARLEGRFETTWVDRGLGDLRVFYYRVASRNALGGIGEAGDPERAVTKPEPLPPIGLALAARALGRNDLAWSPNVEADLATYRLLRSRGEGPFEIVLEAPAGETRAVDEAVGAGEIVRYSLVAVDRDGLASAPSEPLEVTAVGYGLRASPLAGKVLLEWEAQAQEGLQETRILRVGALGAREIGRSVEPRFEAPVGGPGRWRFQLEGIHPDGSAAPASSIAEVEVPPAAE